MSPFSFFWGGGVLLLLPPPDPAGAPPGHRSVLTEQNSHKFFSVELKLFLSPTPNLDGRNGSAPEIALTARRLQAQEAISVYSRTPSSCSPNNTAAPRASHFPSRGCVDVDLPQVHSPPFIIPSLYPAGVKKIGPFPPELRFITSLQPSELTVRARACLQLPGCDFFKEKTIFEGHWSESLIMLTPGKFDFFLYILEQE